MSKGWDSNQLEGVGKTAREASVAQYRKGFSDFKWNFQNMAGVWYCGNLSIRKDPKLGYGVQTETLALHNFEHFMRKQDI